MNLKKLTLNYLQALTQDLEYQKLKKSLGVREHITFDMTDCTFTKYSSAYGESSCEVNMGDAEWIIKN